MMKKYTKVIRISNYDDNDIPVLEEAYFNNLEEGENFYLSKDYFSFKNKITLYRKSGNDFVKVRVLDSYMMLNLI
jgi:histidyl-tRNA synthetase